MQLRFYQVSIALMLIGMNLLQAAEEDSCTPKLPLFNSQNSHTPLLPVGVQILLPEQTFACAGTITTWGVAISGSGSHDVHLQIWRPSGAETGGEERSFTLVGSNIFYVEPIPGIKFFYLMPDGRRALSVKKGDVLGLYIEDAQGTDGSFQVHYQKNVTNSMIYAYKVDMALEHIELSMAASSVLMDAAPVLTVLLDPASIMVEGATPTPSVEDATSTTSTEDATPTTITEDIQTTITEDTTPTTITEDATPTTNTEDATPTTTMEDTTTTPTTMQQESTTNKVSTDKDTTTPTTPTYEVTTPTIKESISTTSAITDTNTTTQLEESDKEETTMAEDGIVVSPDATKPTLALIVVMIASVVMVGVVVMCLVMAVMVARGVKRRARQGHGHCLPHKPASLRPPPLSPPPPPPQYEYHPYKKERNLHATLTSSLSSSLNSSMLWLLHGRKEQLQKLRAREYETPIVTRCHMTVLEQSAHHYDAPIIVSTQVATSLLQSVHHYEDVD